MDSVVSLSPSATGQLGQRIPAPFFVPQGSENLDEGLHVCQGRNEIRQACEAKQSKVRASVLRVTLKLIVLKLTDWFALRLTDCLFVLPVSRSPGDLYALNVIVFCFPRWLCTCQPSCVKWEMMRCLVVRVMMLMMMMMIRGIIRSEIWRCLLVFFFSSNSFTSPYSTFYPYHITLEPHHSFSSTHGPQRSNFSSSIIYILSSFPGYLTY